MELFPKYKECCYICALRTFLFVFLFNYLETEFGYVTHEGLVLKIFASVFKVQGI